MADNLQKFIKVTQEQYNTLASGGTVGSYTGLSSNYIYLVEDNGGSSGMTNPMNTAGDIIIGGTSGAPTRLAKGTNGQVLKSTSNGIEWADEGGNIVIISKTWSELKTLKDNNQLVIGQKYLLTDYDIGYNLSGDYGWDSGSDIRYKSAGHQFDIVLTAISTNSFDENVIPCKHTTSSSDYFYWSKMDAWEIKYCFDNSTHRFAWAASDANGGKGVIYYMKDNYGNEAPYDFKNMLFSENTSLSRFDYLYTFSWHKGSISAVAQDATMEDNTCCNNKIEPLIQDAGIMHLPGNVFNGVVASQTNYTVYCKHNRIKGNRNYFSGRYWLNNNFECSMGNFGSYITGCSIKGSYIYTSSYYENVHIEKGLYIKFGSGTITETSNCITYCKNIYIPYPIQYVFINSADTSPSSSNYLQNIYVEAGTYGTSANTTKTISIPDRNLAYYTIVKSSTSTDLVIS